MTNQQLIDECRARGIVPGLPLPWIKTDVLCPACGSEGPFHVRTTCVAIVSNATVNLEPIRNPYEDDDTYMECPCGSKASAADFRNAAALAKARREAVRRPVPAGTSVTGKFVKVALENKAYGLNELGQGSLDYLFVPASSADIEQAVEDYGKSSGFTSLGRPRRDIISYDGGVLYDKDHKPITDEESHRRAMDAVLDSTIEQYYLNLNKTASKSLKDMGVVTLRRLLDAGADSISKGKGVGPKAIKNIRRVIAKMNMGFSF